MVHKNDVDLPAPSALTARQVNVTEDDVTRAARVVAGRLEALVARLPRAIGDVNDLSAATHVPARRYQ